MPVFALEPTQRAWSEELRTVAAEQLRPLADKGAPGRLNRPLVTALGELGLLERLFTSGALDLCLMRESLAHGCTEAETALALQGLGASPVARAGSDEQRARWLPGVRKGQLVAGFALSEPGAGSDAAALALRAEGEAGVREAGEVAWGVRERVAPEPGARESGVREPGARERAVPGSGARESGVRERAVPGLDARASGVNAQAEPAPGAREPGLAGRHGRDVRDGRDGRDDRDVPDDPDVRGDTCAGGWRLSGEKCWISNAPYADFYTVFARTTPDAGARGITAFLVPADRPGLTGTALDMLSPHPIGTLTFDGVRVTPADVIGAPDKGFRVAMDTLNLFRPSVGAFAVGMAQAALDATLAHTAGRAAFGGPLKDLQSVSHLVAEMATRTEAARLLVYAAAAAYDRNEPGVPKSSAMAKLFATEAAQFVVDAAVQLHGARALQRGHLLEHLYREVRAPRIYEGATEVQRTIIAKELYA